MDEPSQHCSSGLRNRPVGGPCAPRAQTTPCRSGRPHRLPSHLRGGAGGRVEVTSPRWSKSNWMTCRHTRFGSAPPLTRPWAATPSPGRAVCALSRCSCDGLQHLPERKLERLLCPWREGQRLGRSRPRGIRSLRPAPARLQVRCREIRASWLRLLRFRASDRAGCARCRSSRGSKGGLLLEREPAPFLEREPAPCVRSR